MYYRVKYFLFNAVPILYKTVLIMQWTLNDANCNLNGNVLFSM